MNGLSWIRIGALVGGLGVIAGAFGAHGLEGRLDTRALAVFEMAARYQMFHAPALLAVGLLALQRPQSRALEIAGWCFLLGVLVFSGSLYALAITGYRRLGAITPLGGTALIIGWLALAMVKPRHEKSVPEA